jgi:hypothetical protein
LEQIWSRNLPLKTDEKLSTGLKTHQNSPKVKKLEQFGATLEIF